MPEQEDRGHRAESVAHSWRLSSGFRAKWRHWGDEHVLFHVPSGDTHLLDSASTMLLHELERAARPVDYLAQHIVANDLCTADEASLVVEAIVDELSRLGLIEPAR